MEPSSLKRLGTRSLAVTSSAAMVIGLSAAGAAAATPQASPDTDAPDLVSVEISESDFNLDNGDAVVTVTATITDETGVDITDEDGDTAEPVIVAKSTGTTQSHGLGSMELVSGTAQEGEFQKTITIPSGAAAGDWEITLVSLGDSLGNQVVPAELENAGVLASVTTRYNQVIALTAPEFTDENGTENDAFVIPEVDGVVFAVNGEDTEAGTYTEEATGTVVITATAQDDFEFAEDATTEWTHEFLETDLATPAAVTFTDPSGTEDDVYTVPAAENVTYVVNGEEFEAGEHEASGTVTVEARADDGYHFAEDATSEWTYEFNAGDSFVVTATPTVTGEAMVTETLTVDAGDWGPEGVELAYQWNADGEVIEDATDSTLALTADHLGQAITVTVTGSLDGYESDSVTSEATEAVAAADLAPVTPAVTGEATVGEALTAESGDWGPEGVELSYQWSADGEAIEGATEATFTPTEDQVGQRITVTVTGTLAGYNTTSRISAPTAAVAEAEPISFSDVSEGQWFYAPVTWLVENEITTGYTDGTFKPYNAVTRGEAVTFLFRYADEEFTAPDSIDLTDVPPTHNFYEEIAWATENGVVTGYADKTFRAGQNMTRGQVAAILFRQAVQEGEYTAPETSEFTDVDPETTNEYEAISWLHEQQIAFGNADGSFGTHDNISRAEIAAFLERYNTALNN
ncbi:S-layer homology domain-containing protein [Citricoccus alkalitolerans]|uniref:S-layer homology domain-containing protein n=1 Tax=Citricoccus alkalitolerans TaxID=246603 RepID=A0ABV8XTZ8_9MICC